MMSSEPNIVAELVLFDDVFMTPKERGAGVNIH
jgi:hypothetical protein